MQRVNWPTIKQQAEVRKIPLQYIERSEKYTITLIQGNYVLVCSIFKSDPANSDQEDFETNFKAVSNVLPPHEVIGQMEKNDKTLKCFGAYAETDEDGVAEICVPIPTGEGHNDGRWFAYGDAEFDERHFKDKVFHIAIADLDRRIAWMVAQAMDPDATEPLPDEAIIAAGDQIPGGPFPFYPTLETYNENKFPDPMPPNTKGEIFGGMTMSFKYGMTEVQPVGGYGFSPGGFYFVLKAKKDERVGVSIPGKDATPEVPMGSRAGFIVAVTVDWARGDNK